MQDVSRHERGKGDSALVYPVVSRRAKGLSLGLNLFPGGKLCSFDCPYCEVRSSGVPAAFSPASLWDELEAFFEIEYPRNWSAFPLRDLCLSGNGEPSLSPFLREALEFCADARRSWASLAGKAPIRLITNSTGFLDPGVSALLLDFAGREGLEVWAKLDSGSQGGFSAMSRSSYSLDEVCSGLASFAKRQPIVIQTMVCALGLLHPGPVEAQAYAARLAALLDAGAMIEEIQLYTVARRPLEDWVAPLSRGELLDYARSLGEALSAQGIRTLPLSCFGAEGELSLDLP